MADTGWLTAGTLSATYDAGNTPTIDVTDPGNAATDNGLNASWPFTGSGQVGYGLRASNFDFSGIPTNAIIDGFEVRIGDYRSSSASTGCAWDVVRMVNRFGIMTGDNKAADYPSINFIATEIAGGPWDLWNTNLERDDLTDADVGFVISPVSGTGNPGNVLVDYVQIKVYYHVGLPAPISFPNAHFKVYGNNPPHIRSDGKSLFQVTAQNSSGQLRVYGSTNNGVTWTLRSIGQPSPNIAYDTYGMVSSVSDGTLIHIALTWRSGGGAWYVEYGQFNMSTNQWVTTSLEGVYMVGFAQNGVSWCDVAVRSNGEVIVTYNGPEDTVKGGDRCRVDYARRSTGGSWTNNIALDAGGGFSYGIPQCVMAPNDECHIMWGITDVKEDPQTSFAAIEGRTLDSSNSLSTTVGGYGTNWEITNGPTGLAFSKRPITWVDGSTQRIALPIVWNVASINRATIMRGTEDGNGDLAVGDENSNVIDPDPVTQDFYLNYDSADGNIYFTYSGGGSAPTTDQDLYYALSTNEAVSFGTGTELQDGITATRVDANIYTWEGPDLFKGRYLGISYVRPAYGAFSAYFHAVLLNDPNQVNLPSDDLTVTTYAPTVEVSEAGETSQLPAETLSLTDYNPQAVTTDNNISQLDAETLDLTAYSPQAVTSENNYSQLDAETLDLTGFDPQAVTSDNNQSQLDAETLDLADFDPQAVTTEKNIAALDAETLGLAANDPQAVTTEKNIALLVAASVALAAFAPQITTTENNISQIESETLTITNYAPQAVTAANNFAQLPGATLSLSDNDPVIVTTEKNISALDAETLDLTDFDPQVVATENNFSQLDAETLALTDFDPTVVSTENRVSLLDAETLDLVGFDPQTVTTENNTSQLDAETLDLVDYDPTIVTTENNFSQLDAETLDLVGYDPTVVATENHFSQLDAETLTILDYDPTIITTEAGAGDISLLPRPVLTIGDNNPQIVTTENTNPNTSQLDAETLDLVGYDPQAVTTENNVADLDAETLDLVGYAPTAVTTENHFSQLDAETLDLTAYAPEAVTSEGEVSLLPAESLSVADFDPQTVTTENNFSQLDAETLSLVGYAPDAVTTESGANDSNLPSQSLSLTDNDPTVVTTENRVSLLDAETLGLATNGPQIVTTEGVNPNQSNLDAETLDLVGYDPQVVATDNNTSTLASQAITVTGYAPTVVATENVISQLDAETITLTAYAPTVEFTEPSQRLFVIT